MHRLPALHSHITERSQKLWSIVLCLQICPKDKKHMGIDCQRFLYLFGLYPSFWIQTEKQCFNIGFNLVLYKATFFALLGVLGFHNMLALI